MLIDTNAHLHDIEAFPDQAEVVASLATEGISRVITIGACRKSSEDAVALAERFDNIYATVGTHPHDANVFSQADVDYYTAIASHPKVVAIGEAGLDYHYEGYSKTRQADVFVKHIEIASAARLPIVIHVREAFEDTIKILKENRSKLGNGCLMHCYSGSAEMVRELIKLDLEFAIGGVVTFKNAKKLVEAAAIIPLDRLHLETDCPYLAPTPHRGKRNEPKYVKLVAERVAEIRDITLEELAEATTNNAFRLFGKMR